MKTFNPEDMALLSLFDPIPGIEVLDPVAAEIVEPDEDEEPEDQNVR